MFPRQNTHTRRAFRDVTNRAGETDPVALVKRAATASNNNPAAAPLAPIPTRQQAAVARNAIAPQVRSDPQSYQYVGQVDNIDERDADDPLCVTAYVEELYTHFRSVEAIHSINPNYMDRQPHINERMRSILVDWLIEVAAKFRLTPDTTYLCVALVDRFLAAETGIPCTRAELQLVGVTCLLIAAKSEEIYPPELRDLVFVCDRAYTRDQIIAKETQVLRVLNYQLNTTATAHQFLVRYLKAAHADKKIVQLSCYILDGTLTDYSLLSFRPSQLAAAAVMVARNAIGRNSWSPTLRKYANYNEEDIVPVVKAVLAAKANTPRELNAVHKKHSSSRFGNVANSQLSLDGF